MKRYVLRGLAVLGLVGLAAAIFMVAQKNENTASSKEATPASLHLVVELRQGVHAYTGTDGGSSTTVTVCSSPQAYEDFFFSDVKVSALQCAKKQKGIPVSIASNKIVTEDPRFGPSYVVYIRADDSSWSGWTGSVVGIQPFIPKKTLLTINANPNDHDPDRLAPSRDSNFNTGEVLAPGTIVEIISQHPKGDSRDLFVSVQKGSAGLSGKKGWISSMDVEGMYFVPALQP